MNTIESRKYEMLVRVRDFGEAYAARFPESTLAKPLFAKVASAVTDLQANDMRAALQKLDVLDQISGKTKIVGTAGAATRDEENIVRRAIAPASPRGKSRGAGAAPAVRGQFNVIPGSEPHRFAAARPTSRGDI